MSVKETTLDLDPGGKLAGAGRWGGALPVVSYGTFHRSLHEKKFVFLAHNMYNLLCSIFFSYEMFCGGVAILLLYVICDDDGFV